VTSDDSGILPGVCSGAPDAFGALFDRHAPAVFRLCLRRLARQSDAEDAMSATFLQAWMLRDRAHLVDGSLRPWLLAIAVNVTRNAARSERRRRAAWQRYAALAPPTAVTVDQLVEESVAFAGDAALIFAGVKDLPERERVVVELCLLEGMSTAQVAEVLGVAEGTVRSRLSRARARLRALLRAGESPEHSRGSGHHQGGRRLAALSADRRTGGDW